MPRAKAIRAFQQGFLTFGMGALFFAMMTVYLLVTSATDGQRVLSLVVGAIGLLLSLACGVFRTLYLYQKHEERVLKTQTAAIHYPLRAEFEARVAGRRAYRDR